MREALLPPLASAAGLMVLAGVAKLRSPASAGSALGALALPRIPALARGVGAIEICAGALCLLAGGRLAFVALAIVYLAVSSVSIVRWRREEDRAPCGCFGDSSAPVNLGHVIVSLICATVAGAAVIVVPPNLTALLGEGLPAIVIVAGVGCAVYLMVILLTLLPESWRAYGSGS